MREKTLVRGMTDLSTWEISEQSTESEETTNLTFLDEMSTRTENREK